MITTTQRTTSRVVPKSTSATDPALRLTYAIVPPSQATPFERRRVIAATQSERIASLPIDALLVYDVQNEATRNERPRPFAFVPKVDPLSYVVDDLETGDLRCIVYRAVAEQNEQSLRRWLDRLSRHRGRAIFVGAPSRSMSTSMTLSRAYSIKRTYAPELPIGGIVIPERHHTSGAEDARVWAKIRQGCTFFVSQTVWSVRSTERLLRDLRARVDTERGVVPTMLFTLSPCGSQQTLEFLKWLGVDIPEFIQHDLMSAKNMLARSIELAVEIYATVRSYAATQGFTVGCNVESVSSRADEVEASVELVRRIDQLTVRPLPTPARWRAPPGSARTSPSSP